MLPKCLEWKTSTINSEDTIDASGSQPPPMMIVCNGSQPEDEREKDKEVPRMPAAIDELLDSMLAKNEAGDELMYV